MTHSLSDLVLDIDLDYMSTKLHASFEKMAGETLYITGGAGFLGLYLTMAPLAWNKKNKNLKPIQVVISDIFKLGRPEWLAQVQEDPNLKIILHDATTGLPAHLKPNWIIHAASFASPIWYREFPIETIYANINGLAPLLEYAKNERSLLKGMLYFSSSEIYGNPDPLNIPTREDYNGNVSCNGPRACYDESKRLCEALCASYFFKHDVPIKLARPFNNYGPGLLLTDGRVLADLAKNVMQGKDLILFSDGKPTRTFCYVADAVIGYYLVLALGKKGEAYNIGNPKPEISMEDFADLVAQTSQEVVNYKGKVQFQIHDDPKYLTDNPQRRCPDISKAQSQLNFQPEVELEEGVRRYIKWAAGQKVPLL